MKNLKSLQGIYVRVGDVRMTQQKLSLDIYTVIIERYSLPTVSLTNTLFKRVWRITPVSVAVDGMLVEPIKMQFSENCYSNNV